MEDELSSSSLPRTFRLKTFTDKPLLFRYTGAVMAVLAVLALRAFLEPILQQKAAYLSFLMAVAFAAWAFGKRPALVTLLLSGVVANFFFIEPVWTLGLASSGEVLNLLIFCGIGAYIIDLLERQRRYAQQLELEVQQRIKNENSLRRSEERFRLATAAFKGVVYDWDNQTGDTWRSAGITELLGYAPQEIPTSPNWWHEQVHPDDLEPIQKDFESLTAQKIPHQITEYRVQHKDGHYIWVWDNSHILYDAQGRFTRVSGLTLDIDARKQAEARNEALMNFATRLSSALTTGEVVDILTPAVLEAVNGERAGIMVVSKESEMLEWLSNLRVKTPWLKQYSGLPLDGDFMIAKAVREREVLWYEKQADYIAHFPQLEADIKSTQTHAVICLPFFNNDNVRGGLYVTLDHPHRFTLEERSFLFLMAQVGGQALERVKLYEAEQQARQEAERKALRIEILQSITAGLSSAVTLQEVLNVITSQAFGALGAHVGGVGLVTEDQKGVNLVAQYGVKESIYKKYQHIPFTTHTPLSDAASQQRAIWIVSLEEYKRLYPDLYETVYIETQTKAIAALPLLDGKQVIGSMTVSFPTLRTFSPEDRDYLTALAAQSAQALLRAQLSEKASELAVLQERQRIARELHDGATQSIFSANMLIETLPLILQRNPQKALAQIEHIHQLTQGLNSEMRMLLFEFRPENVIKTPLVELLKHLALALQMRRNMTIVTRFTGDQSRTLPENVHFTFYRIAQESLNNIAKHGEASKARVHLHCAEKHVRLSVVDNGRGFETKAISSGFGLNSMRERAKEINAVLGIQSRAGTGTRITLFWQMREEASASL